MADPFATQLRLAEQNFYSSLALGPGALQDFSQTWSELQASIGSALQQQEIDDETLVLAHTIFTRVEIISTHFLELYTDTDTLTNSLQQELSEMFCQLTIQEPLPSPSKPTSTISPPAKSTPQPNSLPPYIQPAHAWLLKNLHDPYPSKELKTKIAEKSNCSFRDIDGWFTSIRKRIGWNQLRAEKFSNKRSLIVKAATKFFKASLVASKCDTYKPIDNSAGKHASDFILIETSAKELYVDKFHETSLASSIDTLVKNPLSVPEIRDGYWKAASSYPSPEHSPNRVPSPPLPPAIPPSAKRKRSDDASSDSHCSHHQKRARISSSHISQEVAAASLPSPAASVQEISHEAILSSVPSSQISLSSPAPSQLCGKRKRSQPSDTEDDWSNGSSPTKRQHVTTSTAHDEACTAQNSLGLTVGELALEQWLNGTVGGVVNDVIPFPVTINSDEIVPVEVDLFSYGSQYSPLTPLSLESPPSSPEPLSPSATIELPNIEAECHDLQPVAENPRSEGSSTSTLNFLPSWLTSEQVNHSISPSLLFSEIETNCPSFVDLTSMLSVPQLAFGNSFSKSRDSPSVSINNIFTPTDTNSSSFRVPFLEDQYAKFSRLQFLRSEVNFLEASLSAI